MIPLPKRPKVEEKKENEATIVIEGLYPGYGVTLGNSLRRILLSSLKGAAITKVKIKDVTHEFRTIPGIKEDGVLITLNLKKVRFKMAGEGPFKIELKAEGEQIVTASEFDLPSQLEVINDDQVIATITDDDSGLEMEAEVREGIGYEAADRRGGEQEEGAILLDAIYSPIKKVAFRVEDMRVGKRTDFDRLILEIETDGRIEPEEAYSRAVEILSEQIDAMSLEEEEEKEEKAEEEEEEKEELKKEEKEEKDPSEILVSETDIPARIVGILEENRVKSLAGLTARSEENIAEMEGIGPKSLENIKKELKKRGLSLK